MGTSKMGWAAAGLLALTLFLLVPLAFAQDMAWGGLTTGGAGTPCQTNAVNFAVDSCTPANCATAAFAPGYDQGRGAACARSAGIFEFEFNQPGATFPSYDNNFSMQYGRSTTACG